MRITGQRLMRAPDGYIGGVCEGLGRHMGISPMWFRLGWIIALFFFGTGFLLYLALWWILPRADALPAEPAIWKTNGKGLHVPPLRRTTTDRKLFGVCGGIARRWDLDPSVVRLAVLSLATLSLGLVGLLYLIAAVVMPSSENPIARPDVYPVEL